MPEEKTLFAKYKIPIGLFFIIFVLSFAISILILFVEYKNGNDYEELYSCLLEKESL